MAKIWSKCPLLSCTQRDCGLGDPGPRNIESTGHCVAEISESHRELREQRINVNTETRSLRKRDENRNTNFSLAVTILSRVSYMEVA